MFLCREEVNLYQISKGDKSVVVVLDPHSYTLKWGVLVTQS